MKIVLLCIAIILCGCGPQNSTEPPRIELAPEQALALFDPTCLSFEDGKDAKSDMWPIAALSEKSNIKVLRKLHESGEVEKLRATAFFLAANWGLYDTLIRCEIPKDIEEVGRTMTTRESGDQTLSYLTGNNQSVWTSTKRFINAIDGNGENPIMGRVTVTRRPPEKK